MRFASVALHALKAAALALPLAASAAPAYTPDEKSILEWLQREDPALQKRTDLSDLIYSDEMVRTALLAQCEREADRFATVERLSNAKYMALISETRTVFRQNLDSEVRAHAGATDGWGRAVIYSYRKADSAQKAAWLHYLRTPQAREGAVWSTRLALIDLFAEDFSMDGVTGEILPWLHWLDEYLVATNTKEAFLKALDTAKPGLGARFATYVAQPRKGEAGFVPTQTLSIDISHALPGIGQVMARLIDPEAARALARWNDDPIVARARKALEDIASIRAGDDKKRSAADPLLLDMMTLSPADQQFRDSLHDRALALAVKVVEGKCATLR